MKRSLIALALAGLLANVAFAQATLTGDDTYDAVHLLPSKSAPEAIAEERTEATAEKAKSESRAKEESAQSEKSNTYGQFGVYEFNP